MSQDKKKKKDLQQSSHELVGYKQIQSWENRMKDEDHASVIES